MRILITLGPTKEYIDAVRFISNNSSGRMGFSLAEESIARGYDTIIISGPVTLEFPGDWKVIKVISARDMINKTLGILDEGSFDVFICSAAISDYSVKNPTNGKIPSNKDELVVILKRNPKLTLLVREKFPKIFIVGFKAEYNIPEEELLRRAYSKLVTERLDLVFGNDIAKFPMGSEKTGGILIDRMGKYKKIEPCDKRELAKIIFDEIEKELKRNAVL